MYIFVFGVIGTIITFSVVAPLTYLANKNNMFYFTFYDKNSFDDSSNTHGLPTHHPVNNTLPLLNEKTQLSSHLMLNSYLINPEKNETVIFNKNITNKTSEIDIFTHSVNNNSNVNSGIAPVKEKVDENKNKEKENDNYYKDSIINFTMKDILLFSAVISATDTVAALTFIKEDKDPKLFAILFGEGVLNDAVCIVLYRIIKEFTESNEGNFYRSIYFLYFIFFKYTL